MGVRTSTGGAQRIGLRVGSSGAAGAAVAGRSLAALEQLQDGVRIDPRWRDLPLVPALPGTDSEALDALHAAALVRLRGARDRPRDGGRNGPDDAGWARIGRDEQPAIESLARINAQELARLNLEDAVLHLGRYVFVEVPESESADELLQALRGSGVERAWLESGPAPAPALGGWTPDSLPPQFWDAPAGTDARYANALGAYGGGVRLVDIEHAFAPHVELGPVRRLGGAVVAREAEHGTAVLGLIAASEDVHGGSDIRGLAPAVELGFVSLWFEEAGVAAPSWAPASPPASRVPSPACRCRAPACASPCTCGCASIVGVADAAPAALADTRVATFQPSLALYTALHATVTALDGSETRFLRPGDVLLIEAQRWHRTSEADPGVLLPLESDPVLHSLIAHAVSLGIVVVAAAGNGGVDLDGYDLGVDSGSILVGAADPQLGPRGHVVSHFGLASGSNFGARVRTYGWGASLVAPGGDPTSSGPQVYTDSFGGTSGAAAQIAAAVATLQSALIDAHGGPALGPAARLALETAGAPVVADATAESPKVGQIPDLRRILRDTLALSPDVFVERWTGDVGEAATLGPRGDTPSVRGTFSVSANQYDLSASVLRRDGGVLQSGAQLRLGLLVPSTFPRLESVQGWVTGDVPPDAASPSSGKGGGAFAATPAPLTIHGREVDPIMRGTASIVAVVDAPGDPAPRLETYGDAAARAYLLQYENNVAFQTVARVPVGVIDALPFLLEAPFDFGRPLELALSWQGLPVGTAVTLLVEGALPASILTAVALDPTKLRVTTTSATGKETLLAGVFPNGLSSPAMLQITLQTPLTAQAEVHLTLLDGPMRLGHVGWQIAASV